MQPDMAGWLDAVRQQGVMGAIATSAGEALPADLLRRFKERTGVDILDGLGSTEMLHIFLSNRQGDVKPGTSGTPIDGYTLRIVDDEGNIRRMLRALLESDGYSVREAATAEEGIAVTEEGEINFPKEMVEKIAKVNLLPRTILEVEKDGGWSFVAATGDDHYVFKRAK